MSFAKGHFWIRRSDRVLVQIITEPYRLHRRLVIEHRRVSYPFERLYPRVTSSTVRFLERHEVATPESAL